MDYPVDYLSSHDVFTPYPLFFSLIFFQYYTQSQIFNTIAIEKIQLETLEKEKNFWIKREREKSQDQ